MFGKAPPSVSEPPRAVTATCPPATVLEITPVMIVEPEPLTVKVWALVLPISIEPESVTALPEATVLTSVKPPLTSLTGLANPML